MSNNNNMAASSKQPTMILPDLKGKVVFITGASSGVGQAAAVEFARQGCRVAVHGRNESRLQQTVQMCVDAGAERAHILHVIGDVTSEVDNEDAVDKVLREFGTVHVLVNNAASAVSGQGSGLDSHSLDDMLAMLRLHVVAPFHLIKLLKSHLIQNKGSIVNVSSDSAHRPDPGMLGYTVGKSGLVGLSKCVALELARQGVRCNVVSPSWVNTPFLYNSGFIDNKEEAMKFISDSVNVIPARYVAEPAEIGRMIVFVASGCCNYLTGQDVVVDGGSTLTSLATCQHLLKDECEGTPPAAGQEYASDQATSCPD